MFGTRAAEFPEANQSGNNDDVWIRTFNQESTIIRIAPVEAVLEDGREVKGTEAWIKELEHYDKKGFGRSFPCPVPHGFRKDQCPGCTHKDEDVRKRSAKWYFNALDDKDYLRVFKIGVKLLRKFKLREQRLGTLSDRDYEVIRSGKEFNEIEYDLEAGDKDTREFPEELHDIGEILSRNWKEALEYYSGKTSGKAEETDDHEEDAPLRDEQASMKDKLAAERAERNGGSKEEGEKILSDKDILELWGKHPEPSDIEAAETADIKEWLTAMEVEFPSRAPRSRLVSMAKEKAAAPPF